jgi:hypothetical protein
VAIARTEYAIKRLLALGGEIGGSATTRGCGGALVLWRARVAFHYWRAAAAATTLPVWRGRIDELFCKDEA